MSYSIVQQTKPLPHCRRPDCWICSSLDMDPLAVYSMFSGIVFVPKNKQMKFIRIVMTFQHLFGLKLFIIPKHYASQYPIKPKLAELGFRFVLAHIKLQYLAGLQKAIELEIVYQEHMKNLANYIVTHLASQRKFWFTNHTTAQLSLQLEAFLSMADSPEKQREYFQNPQTGQEKRNLGVFYDSGCSRPHALIMSWYLRHVHAFVSAVYAKKYKVKY